eukprot:symbB.v1.2.022828.t1/scaffold2043.1/size110972/2
MEKSERRRLAAAAAEKRLRVAPGAPERQDLRGEVSSDCDPRASELLKVFDKVHAEAVVRHKNTGMDAHHAPALRKAKKSVEGSLARGDNLTLSSLHTLKNVGHWVVSQLRESLEGSTMPPAKRTKQQAAATPEWLKFPLPRALPRPQTRLRPLGTVITHGGMGPVGQAPNKFKDLTWLRFH